MTRNSPEWITTVLDDFEKFCLANSMPQSKEAIVYAIRKAESQSRSELLDAAMAVSAANALNNVYASKYVQATK